MIGCFYSRVQTRAQKFDDNKMEERLSLHVLPKVNCIIYMLIYIYIGLCSCFFRV
jgi:hypothetical protein